MTKIVLVYSKSCASCKGYDKVLSDWGYTCEMLDYDSNRDSLEIPITALPCVVKVENGITYLSEGRYSYKEDFLGSFVRV